MLIVFKNNINFIQKQVYNHFFSSRNPFVCFTCSFVISDWLILCLHNCRFVHGRDRTAYAFQMHVPLHGPLRLTAWFFLTPKQGFLCTKLTLLYILWDFIKLTEFVENHIFHNIHEIIPRRRWETTEVIDKASQDV